ncbi:hypothetical protein F441_22681, partial [Phytophthora nicotianae CJ01A1]
ARALTRAPAIPAPAVVLPTGVPALAGWRVRPRAVSASSTPTTTRSASPPLYRPVNSAARTTARTCGSTTSARATRSAHLWARTSAAPTRSTTRRVPRRTNRAPSLTSPSVTDRTGRAARAVPTRTTSAASRMTARTSSDARRSVMVATRTRRTATLTTMTTATRTTTATLTTLSTRATWTTGVTALVIMWAARTRRATASTTRSITHSASPRFYPRESSVARMTEPTCGGTLTAPVVRAASPWDRTTAARKTRSATTTTVASAVRKYNAARG